MSHVFNFDFIKSKIRSINKIVEDLLDSFEKTD